MDGGYRQAALLLAGLALAKQECKRSSPVTWMQGRRSMYLSDNYTLARFLKDFPTDKTPPYMSNGCCTASRFCYGRGPP